MTDDSRRQDTDGSAASTERGEEALSPDRVSLEKSSPGGPSASGPDADRPAARVPVAETHQTRQGGASPWAEAQAATSAVNTAQDKVFQSGVGRFQAQGDAARAQSDVAQKKLVAGLLGILLGSLGVHKFYLGMNKPGVIMLVCTLAGYLLFTLLFIVLIGFVFLLMPAAVGVIGLIEGVLYLTKSDADFQREYLIGKKPWF